MILKILHIVMAFHILLLSSYIPISLHYCQDNWSGISLYVEATSCHDIESYCAENQCCTSAPDEGENCCSNEKYITDAEDHLIFYPVEDLQDYVPPTSVASVSSEYNFFFDTKINRENIIRPPPKINNYQIAFQQFLC